MHALKAVLEQVEAGALLPDSFFVSLEIDEALERRDRAGFEKRWLAAFEKLEAAWKERAAPQVQSKLVDRIREVAFKRAFHASDGHHDLAATISDDFDLICRRKLLDVNVPFVDELERAYLSHQLPT